MATIDIDKFRSAIMSEDLGRTNLFKVEFAQKWGKVPPSVRSSSGGESIFGSIVGFVTKEVLARSEPLRHITGFYSPEILRAIGLGGVMDKYLKYPYDLGLYVQSVGLPGRILNTTDITFDQVPHAIVNGAEYDLLTMTFLTSPSQKERRRFLEWCDTACNPNNGKYGYYDSYVMNINIKFYNRQGEMASITEVVEAFPVHVSEMQLSYQDNNQLATFDVQFKFKKARTEQQSDNGDGNILTEAKHWYDSIKRITKII